MRRTQRNSTYWLVSHGLLSLLLQKPNHQPSNSTTHIVLSPSQSINNKLRKCPTLQRLQDSLHPNLMETFSSVEIPYSQRTLAFVKLTKINQHATSPQSLPEKHHV